MSKTLLDLTNAEFQFTFDGKEYLVQKANIRKVIAYNERLFETQKNRENNVGRELSMGVYAVFLILKDHIPDLTEEIVTDKMRGNVELLDLLIQLGFMSPEKAQMAKDLQNGVIEKYTGTKSSPTSAIELDGPQPKSETSPSNS